MKRIIVGLSILFILGCMEKTDDKGFYLDGNKKKINKFTKTKYDKDGYNYEGFDVYGYDKDGFNNHGFDINNYDRNGYDRNGYNKLSINKDTGTEYNLKGFNRAGYDKDGFNNQGFDKFGYNKDGYDKSGYNKDGYDKDGYNKENFNKNNIHKLTKTKYDIQGFDKFGYHKDTNTKYNLDLTDKEGKKLKTLLYIGQFVDEFNQKTNENFLAYEGKITSYKYGKSSQKELLLLVTKNSIEFRLTPYVFLNSDGYVNCSIKIGEKIIKTKLWASKDSGYIFKKNNVKEYTKIINAMKNEGLMQIVIYNYDSSESFKTNFPIDGFSTLIKKI